MSERDRNARAACARSIDSEILMDYWLALLPDDAGSAVDEHLLECDACGNRLRETIAFADALRTLARSGALSVVVSDRFVAHAEATGVRVRQYAPLRGESVQCTVAADDDLLVARLATSVTAAGRVDLSWCDHRGVEQQRMIDIPVREDADGVVCQQAIAWAKAAPSGSMTARLLAVDETGGERLLGEYTFHHTRTIPGPPGLEQP